MMPTRQRCRLRMGKQSEDKEQVVQPQGGRFNHPYLTPYLTPYRVPHSLPHSLPPSIPHSRRIKQKHCLEITQRLTLFQKIAGRNGVQFQLAIAGQKSHERRSWQGQTNPYLTPYLTPYLIPYLTPYFTPYLTPYLKVMSTACARRVAKDSQKCCQIFGLPNQRLSK